MCWNADISINTFIFSLFGLIFIYISNTYTRYKVEGFTNLLTYLFVLLVVSMQLLEFFIWKNLNNPRMNTFFSKVGFFIIFSQILLVNFLAEPIYQPYLLFFYFIFIVTFLLFKQSNPIQFKTTVAPNGHLSWEWFSLKGFEKIFLLIGFTFYIIPWLLNKNISTTLYLSVCLAIFSFFIMYMILKKDNTYGSLWCWGFNLMMIFYVVKILLILPFCEYHGLC